jgi:hypothetical protein
MITVFIKKKKIDAYSLTSTVSSFVLSHFSSFFMVVVHAGLVLIR